MKIQNIIFSILLIGFTITSCKKEKKDPTASGGSTGHTLPATNYYIFNNDTFIAVNSNLGYRGWSDQFIFYCSNKSGGGGSKLVELQFLYTGPGQPLAGTYSVVAHSLSSISDSTTCSVSVKDTDTTGASSVGGGTIVVGKSGTATTYEFSNLPLFFGKSVTGKFKF